MIRCFVLCCVFRLACFSMDFSILEDGTPIRFYYGCSDLRESYQVFHSGDTLGFFYDETKLLGSCHRDLRVLMQNSECSLNAIEFFFCYSEHFSVYFCANNKSRVSSLSSKIEDLINVDTECVKNFYRETFKLRGKKEIYFDKPLKECGSLSFLKNYITCDDSCGIVKQHNLLEDYDYGFPKNKIRKKN
ncbi:MAG: hypothetical protein LBT63_03440 [Holosporaceae bacterium]|jgi:hypothetical protein|nr:hypothetical protein [Holosporaceae bacterium]